MIQEEGLTQIQSERLESAYNAVQKLTTLSRHLLLLAKIGNRKFNVVYKIQLDKQLKKRMADFSVLWEIEGLQFKVQLHR